MHSDEESFLEEAKVLINSNKRHFVMRRNQDFRQDLLDLGLGRSIEKVWDTILNLNPSEMTKPPEADDNGSGKIMWFFQKTMLNGVTAYIKLTIDKARGCVCISFHPVRFGKNAQKHNKQ